MRKERVWELDALRGLCVLGMIVLHFVYDLVELWGIIRWEYPPFLVFLMDWGGVLFLLISGISATLGSRSLIRGFLVFSCGMLITAVTAGMALLGASCEILIYFGTLHCLGICMILWHFLKVLPTAILTAAGTVVVAAGLYLQSRTFAFPWLIPLGFVTAEFVSADYFPLLPNLGFFLLGAALGRILYPGKTSLFPRFPAGKLPVRLLTFCGRHALVLYLLHQPILAGICGILAAL